MTKAVPDEALKELAAVAAQQEAMRTSCVFLPHGGRLFRVEVGWQSVSIRNDCGTTPCTTLLELEAVVRDPDSKIIFIPSGALITDADIEKICHRNGVPKMFFREVDVV